MKAHVLTTTRSASSALGAGTYPSATSVPMTLSESTWFFGQPRVSTQKESGTTSKLPVGLASAHGDDRDDQSEYRRELGPRPGHGGSPGSSSGTAGTCGGPNLGSPRFRRTP